MQAVAPPAPAHIVKTLVDQEQSSATGGIKGRWQCGSAGLLRKTAALILNLPNQPIGRKDATNAQLLGGVLSIPMANGVDQGLVQPQLDPLTGENTTNWLGEKLEQRGQLQGGRQSELSPAKPLERHSGAR